jgi:nucleoid DNA-binding protein
MTKEALKRALLERHPELTHRAADALLATLFHPVHGLLAQGLVRDGKVVISGFGSFHVAAVAGKSMRDPNNPARLRKVPGRRVARFRAGAPLRESVNRRGKPG